MVRALRKITVGNKVYEEGQIITGLSFSDIEWLIANGHAIAVSDKAKSKTKAKKEKERPDGI